MPRRENRRPRRRAFRLFSFLERLEDKLLLAGNVISGFVYNDVNQNGLFDTGEPPIANTPIQLRNSSGVIVGSTTTDASGAYQFNSDATISVAPQSITQTATIPDTPTPNTASVTLPQFDPTLGTLTSVTINNIATTTDTVQLESQDTQPTTLIANTTITTSLTGPGVSGLTTTANDSVSFNATAFDGVIDFGGTSGHDFGPRSQTRTQSTTITDPATLSAYLGTGTLTFSSTSTGTSSVLGSGNVVQIIGTSSGQTIQIVYNYIPSNALVPGNYTIVEPVQPPGFTDGLESSNGVVIPNSIGTDFIAVTLANADLPNNNFGELTRGVPQLFTSSLSGNVYSDLNNNGLKDPGELGIGGTTIYLTGTTSGTKLPLFLVTTTAQDGSYTFANLPAGTYTITEVQPAGFLDGKDAIGTQGGTVGDDLFSGVTLADGQDGINNNFGELLPATLSGFEYYDVNNDGIKQSTEFGIAHVVIILAGTDDLGQQVTRSLQTNDDGSYAFVNLRPGTYTIASIQPTLFRDGKTTAGTLGGTATPNRIANIAVSAGQSGLNNNFGELARPGCRLPGLTEFHTLAGNRLAARQIGPLLRYAMPTLVPAITRASAVARVSTPANPGSSRASAVAEATVTPKAAQPTFLSFKTAQRNSRARLVR